MTDASSTTHGSHYTFSAHLQIAVYLGVIKGVGVVYSLFLLDLPVFIGVDGFNLLILVE